jgi:glucose uptake protein
MYLPATYSIALVMTVLTMFCWGSWANSYKATRGYRFELFYWDYIAGVVVLSVVLALTVGSFGSTGEPFLRNVMSADAAHWIYALVAGFIFNIANLLLVAALDITGLAVAFPISIGIAIVEGVVLSYVIQPIGNPLYLGGGVALAILAVIFDAMAYRSLGAAGVKVSTKGIVVSVVSGILMGGFAPFVTKALTGTNPLTPYSIIVLFSLGALLSCFVFNIYFMRKPLVGEPVNFSGFFTAGARNHAMGFAGGVVWGLGTAFNFVAAGVAGVAISYAIGQAAPMIAALWGVVVWREFSGANRKAWTFLSLMFLFYILAVVLIAGAHNG